MAQVPAIGIDLGTTFSCVAVMQNGKVRVIPNDKGNRITPSMVAFTDEGRLYGEDAKPHLNLNPQNTVYGIKRLMGKEFQDKEVKKDIKTYPFTVISKDRRPTVQVKQNGEVKEYFPEEISAMVLGKMKSIAEAYLKEPVMDVVITVPAYFDDSQRQATIDAGTIAGLNVLRVISEPTAAAVAYGMDTKKKKDEEKILVYDLGGGTFDVSILRLDDGIFEVMSTSGDTHLGGHDFDERMVEHFVKEYQEKHGADLKQDIHALVRLRSACEQLKHKLSVEQEAEIQIDNLLNQNDFNSKLTRQTFEKLNADLFSKTLDSVKKALSDAKMKPSKVKEVILVGGPTRIPKIQEIVQNFFKGKTLNKSIHPDEAVAVGAATLAARLSGATFEDKENMVLLDVIPISLGIELYNGDMCTLIPRNRSIPTEEKRYASTEKDYQREVFVKVLQGENPRAADNRVLGTFILGNLPRKKAGEVNIEVTYEVDVNGILKCTAEEKSKGNTKSITIKNEKGNLTKQEIERLAEMLQKQTMEDNEILAKVAARCFLEEHANYVKRCAEDDRYKDRVSKSTIATVLSKCNDALLWLEIDVPRTKQDYETKLKQLEEATKPFTKTILKGKQEFKLTISDPPPGGAAGGLDLD